MIVIDGGIGEGGGQILRSSLTLSMLTGEPVRFHSIRAGRAKPGLLRQHLACVEAASVISNAKTVGTELSSTELSFTPGPIVPGKYSFSIGGAGSTTLVLQTVLLALLGTGSVVTVRGGTHNPLAPSFDYLSRVFLPLLRQQGPSLSATLLRHGFAPVGGGEVQVEVQGAFDRAFDLGMLRGDEGLSAWTLSQGIPAHVDSRELRIVARDLSIPFERCERKIANSPCSGNVLEIQVGDHELITCHGARGKSAEKVASEAVAAARGYLNRGVCVGEYLADQLMLPLALAGGRFLTGPLSLHATTNLLVIQRFLGTRSISTRACGGLVEVSAPGHATGLIKPGS